MNDLQIFNNPQFGEIRTITEDGVTLFCAKDVAVALGYKDPTNAIKQHCRGVVKRHLTDSLGRDQLTKFIPEGDIYRLAARSELPGADAFERWIFDEVLPSIRQTGAYLTPELAKALADLPAVMELMAGMEERLSALEWRGTALPARLEALPFGAEPQTQVPGAAFRKRWMRTVSEKLNLLQVRFDMTHNELLHQLYKILERENDVVLEEEKLRAMEEHGLEDCSVLTAIFYNPDLRDSLQGTIDYNLAPENRGW